MGAWEHHLPAIAMVLMQVLYAAMALLNRAALVKGMSPRVFIFYRQTIATLVISPIAYLIRGRSNTAGMGFRSFLLIFVTAFIGVALNQNMYFEGLYLASSSIASATSNMIPAVTFLIAVAMGLEQVQTKTLSSAAKILGTAFCVGGAISMALLRGPKLLNAQLEQPNSLFQHLLGVDNTWLLGCLCLFASSCCWSLWLILQGILGSGVQFFIQSWCISLTGPFYAAMFTPLATVITTVLACIFLHEELYVGSLLGAVAVIIGLYVVLWGKSKELKSKLDPISGIGPIKIAQEKCDKIDLEQPLLIDDTNTPQKNEAS
ncbi:WAT1-related protein At4g30420 isoform X2 [Beta vulgaris subsp. vulgaris]|uniref:WAT1-related protein At4g30420 isoform X2 n=1 Tax=Beta vulgaris subsp. vulgaris TaxID=3555 RepID=UPI00203676C7|nr:WAT1-related protein At4g30420 isoform X2 [Beta vulgaris subsp. vulgaris]